MDFREGIPAVRNHGQEGNDTMQTVKAFRGNARTFLTHMFGRGLDDDRYVIERFQSKADGEIRRHNGTPKKSRGKASREIVSLSTVQRMRPKRDEIIVCTGIAITSGIQYWGDRAMGFLVNARHR